MYEQLFHGQGRITVEFYDYTTREERYPEPRSSEASLWYPLGSPSAAPRQARIFRRAGTGWRQIHHHGSIEDPALLAAYQGAVSPGPR